jgi:hypothetical protein
MQPYAKGIISARKRKTKNSNLFLQPHVQITPLVLISF